MKLLIPLSFFQASPRSELWQIDTTTHTQRHLTTLPDSLIAVPGKGITGVCWLDKKTLIACDYNRILKINRENWQILGVKIDDEFNDLHALSIAKNTILISNTGRDSVDFLTTDFKTMRRHSSISTRDFNHRKAGNYSIGNDNYFDNPASTLPFSQRKVPDTHHLNHALTISEWADKVLVNCFKDKCLRDLTTWQPISNTLPEHLHDGVVHRHYFWVTTVEGKLYKAPLKLPFVFELALDLFAVAAHHGWCRGLFFKGDRAYIGVTQLYEKNARTQWLKQDLQHSRTGVYQFNLKTQTIEHFYDLSHTDGARIFSIVEDKC